MKKRFVAFLLVLIMVLGMLPVSALAASNSTVWLHPSVNSTVTGVKVKVGDKIDGYPITSISGYDITVDLGKYNVNNDTFRLPYAKDIWEGVDNNKVDYISWAGGGSNKRSEGGSALLVNGKNTAYYYFKGATPTKYTYHLIHEFNYVGGTRWDIMATTAAESYQIDVNKGKPTRDRYKFDGWADTANATTAKYFGGELITLTKDNPTKTIYAVWKPIFELHYNANGGTGAPDSQTYTSLSATTTQATFTVPNQTPTKEGYTFKGWADSATATAAQYQPGGPIAVKHENSPKTVYAVWECNHPKDNDGNCTVPGCNHPDSCCPKKEEPGPGPSIDPPSENNLLGLTIAKVYCAMPANHGSKDFDYLGGTLDTSRTYTVNENGFCTVYLHVAPYVASYNGHYTSSSHARRAEDPTTVPVTLVYDNGHWEVARVDDAEALADIPVYCAETPVEPEKPTALDGSFAIVCKNNEATHAHKADYIATPSQYTISDVQTDEQGYYVTATVTVAPNLVAYNTLTGAEHRLVNEQDATLTITFRYDAEVTGDENRKWTQQGELPVVEVICKPKAPTADDLKKIEMAVQVKCVVDDSQQHTEAYGLLGECDEDYFVGEPRKDGDDWLCDISYVPDRYVAAFNTTFQNLKHVQTDEQIVPVTLIWAGDSWQLKTQGRVHVTEVYTVTYTDGVENEEVFADQVYSDLRKDSTTPAFNGTPTRTGYTFAGWEPEVAETVTANATYTAKWTPVEPTRDDIFKALKGLVTVTCINRFWKDGNKNMDCGQVQYGAMAGIVGQDYTLEKGENDTTWVVTFPVTNFVKSFKQDPAHNLYTKDTLSWYIRWEDNAWTSAPVESGVDDLVKLTHAPTDWREVAKIATGGKSDCIHTSCVNGETGVCDYGITVPFVYSATDVVSVEPEDGVPGSYIATFKVDRYIDTCAKACNDKNFPDAPRTHKLLTPETVRWRLCATDVEDANDKIGNNVPNHVWEAEPVEAGKDDVCTVAHNWVVTFNPDNGEPAFTQDVEYEGNATEPAVPEKTGYTFDGWFAPEAEEPFNFDTTITSDITLTAKWEAKKANVHLMIFKSSDLTKAIVDVPYAGDKLAGETIDLTEIDPSSYLDFDFEIDGGWYDDGMFNSYKRYLDGLQDKPAGLEKLLITGNWQNLKLIVTELVPVVYFDSLESLTAYQNDHSKTEGILHTTKARLGSALPTADAPTATRDGYTFTFWSREGQTVDVTDQTVNGWTNLYANWKVTPHNIYAFARLNSAFAPLTSVESGEFVELNDATLERLGLGSYNDLDYISIGTFDFDEMPLTEELYMAYYEDPEIEAVADALADSIALETGVSDKIAEKIAWTALYKTVNEEDMEPGYPTNDEEGYQLSGNLDLATVMFKAGGDNVEGMPAVNYTYDDILEIHDFYFAGDTFTLPADPTREGYIFEGWSVKVIPDENDADHLDADGADDAADETLLKSGDTYTITAGGVIFTAQWKLNTYIIASTLRINGNEPVKETGKTYSWSHRYGGDFGVTIDYTEMFKALKDKTLEVDAANEPYDAEIKLCFPGSKDRLFNEEILTYGQEGGGWNSGVKNTAYIWGYATTSYEVIFNSDGGSDVDTQIVKYGEKAVKPEDPTMKGYNFLGWFDKDGNPFDFDTEITRKTELTAQWEKKDYIIASDLRVNGDTANLADGKDYPWTHRYGGKYEETIDYQPMFDALKARALEADKANEPNPTKVDVELRFPGSKDRLFNEEIHTYGQDGGGWNPGVKNTAYIWGYAWTYYDVTFVTPEGATTVDAQLIKNGDCAAKPADPTKEGWKFLGWYADAAFETEFNFDAPITKKTSVYAKFELVSTPIGDIYVRYDVLHIKQLPDGSYDLANAEVEHLSAKKDTTVTAVVKDYSATHHINVNSTLSKLTDTAIRPYPGADGKPVYTILSVYYDLDFHTLTFDTMGGSRIDPVTVRHGNAVAKPKDPVNGGYIFDGWYTDKTYRTPYNFATVLTQDTTIYAKWFLIALPGVTIKKTTPKLNTSDHFAYVQGYPDGTVKPTGNITRAETAAILFRLMDEGSRKTYYSTKSGFRDVATGSWYNTYVATLNNAGVITDSSNGYFRPNEAITRAELAAMLANFTETAGAANYFNDVSASYWAANAIAICAKLGWITGYPDGSFRPDRNVTRAELMAMINRATGRAPKSADAFLPGMKTWSDNTADKWYYLDVQEATNSHSYTVKDSEKWTALNADPNWSLYE